MRLIRRLRQVLGDRGVSVYRWAQASGVDRTYLHRILKRGSRCQPSLALVDQLVDGAYICLRWESVQIEIRLHVGGELVRGQEGA